MKSVGQSGYNRRQMLLVHKKYLVEYARHAALRALVNATPVCEHRCEINRRGQFGPSLAFDDALWFNIYAGEDYAFGAAVGVAAAMWSSATLASARTSAEAARNKGGRSLQKPAWTSASASTRPEASTSELAPGGGHAKAAAAAAARFAAASAMQVSVCCARSTAL